MMEDLLWEWRKLCKDTLNNLGGGLVMNLPQIALEMKQRAEAAETRVAELTARVGKLEAPFRNVDDRDWDDLFANVIPSTTRHRFWRTVLLEARAALAKARETGEREAEG